VAKTAYVGSEASVFDSARVFEYACVTDSAWVRGNAEVSGKARIGGEAVVAGNAMVSGAAEVAGDAYVSGGTRLGGDSRIDGDARLGDDPADGVVADTLVDRDGVAWRWDGSVWSCWVADRWVSVPGADPVSQGSVTPVSRGMSMEGDPRGTGAPHLQPTPVRYNACAVLSLVFALALPIPIAAIVLGFVAHSLIRKSNGRERGRALADWGIVLGVMELIGLTLVIAIVSVAAVHHS
jgi:hypothetical protein